MYRVLIVDDETWIRSSLEKKVNESGIALVSATAANGMIALTWLSSHYADICITDVRMPLMNGLDLIKQINILYPWMATVVVSSYDDFSYASESIQIGALDYILKPVEQVLLKAALVRAQLKTTQTRHHDAFQILYKKLPHHRHLLARWMEQIHTFKYDTMPILVVDTLELLQSWVGNALYLLEPISLAWLNMICEEFRTDKFQIDLDESDNVELGELSIPNDKVRSYFRLCAIKCLEEGAIHLFHAVKTAKENPTHKVVEDVKKYIQLHFTEKISLQDIAEYSCMSRTYMTALFKHETGMTVWDCLIDVRMKKAKELLLQSNKKVYEIAHDVGYENIVHFTKLFKEHYNFSPSEYKKKHGISAAT